MVARIFPFRTGQIRVTNNARFAMKRGKLDPNYLVALHANGEWGIVDESTASANLEAVNGADWPIDSRYATKLDETILVSTFRCVTVISTPEDHDF